MPHDTGYPLTTTREYIHLIPISVGKWRRVSNQCEWSRIEDRGGGGRRVKKGRTKMQVEMIVGTEKIRGVEVSAHTGTQVIVTL